MKKYSLVFIIGSLITLASCGSSNKVDQTSQVQNSTQTETRSSTRERPQQGNRQGPPSVDEIFKMDTNNDGLLAKSELKGRLLEDFTKIDTNKDGFISKEELESRPKPQRGQGRQRN